MARAADFFASWVTSQDNTRKDWAKTTEKLKQFLLRQRVLTLTATKETASEVPGRELFDTGNAWLTLMGASVHASDWWLKGIEVWAETAKQFHQYLLNRGEATCDSAERPEEMPADLMNTWGPLVGSLVEGKKPAIVKETAFKLLGSIHLYNNLYETCLPLFRVGQEETPQTSPREEMINPAPYKVIMDTLFGVDPGGAMAVAVKAKKLLAGWGLMDGHTGNWFQAVQKTVAPSPHPFEGRLDVMIRTMRDLFDTLGPSGTVAPSTDEGEDERAMLLLALCDGISKYMSAITAYQRLIYATGLKAINKAIAALCDGNGKGEKIKNFDDFFRLWLNVCEQDFQILFAAEEFSKLHGELINAAMHVRMFTMKLTELQFRQTPFVVRSEVDDLYKAFYDLRKEVRLRSKKRKEVVREGKRPQPKLHGRGKSKQ